MIYGYAIVSAGALGIAPASFYFACGNKGALCHQCVQHYVATRDAAYEAAFRAATPRAAVETLLQGYVDVATDPGHPPGCLIVNGTILAGGLAVEAGTGATREDLYAAVAFGMQAFPDGAGQHMERDLHG